MKISLFACALALAFAGATAGAQTTWDLPSAYPAGNFHLDNLAAFAKDVDAFSGGKLQIAVHDNASQFKAPEIKPAVQAGKAQAGEILLVNYAAEGPAYSIDGLPFLATGYQDAWKLYQAQKPFLEKKLDAQGMMLLYTVPWPPQGLFANKEINTVADMKDLKWRAYSPATAKIAELVAAQPVTVQQSELSQSMATGVIDSYMSSAATGLDTKTYEHIKKFYDTQAWLPKNAVIANKAAFAALDPATQEALKKAAAQAEARGWKLSESKNTEYLKALADKGMQVLQPSAELKSGLSSVGAKMRAEWLKQAGEEGKTMVDAYRE